MGADEVDIPPICARIIADWAARPRAEAPVTVGDHVIHLHRPSCADHSIVRHGRVLGSDSVTDPVDPWPDLPRVELPAGHVPRRADLHHDGTGYVTAVRPGQDIGLLTVLHPGTLTAKAVPRLTVRSAHLAVHPVDGRALVLDGHTLVAVHPHGGYTRIPLPSAGPGTTCRVTAHHDTATVCLTAHGRVDMWELPTGSDELHPSPILIPPGTTRILATTHGYAFADGHPGRLVTSDPHGQTATLPLPTDIHPDRIRRLLDDSENRILTTVDDDGLTALFVIPLTTGRLRDDLDPTDWEARWQGHPGEQLTGCAVVAGHIWWATASPLDPCRARLESLTATPPGEGDQLDERARPRESTRSFASGQQHPPHPQATPPPAIMTTVVTARDSTRLTVRRAVPIGSPVDAPILLTCYGGFGVIHDLEAAPTALAWAALGGVTAAARVRGGGEHGPAWYRAGSGTAKKKAVDDLVDVIDALSVGGSPIVLVGASHGGWLAASAALRRPGLAGIVLTAPLLDVSDLRRRHPAGSAWEREFGVGEPGVDLAALSPLLLLETAGDDLVPPPCLVFSPQDDRRVSPEDADRWVRESARRGAEATLRATSVGHSGNGRVAADARLWEILHWAARQSTRVTAST
ncbi:prolyl oligopeptidase family serine peptidase [Austwickia chelonae]|uniref:prolyl oligopeptidase family serine peptidase n=1 Tax=Austwickia chelonae TaxID=100225 RepID=UPI000E25EBEF|nr:prolyl oligopeptidase family serine peptidase [Austwickia chelonae]